MFLIEEMRCYNQVSSFDEQPRAELNSEAIDFRAASEFFRPTRKLTRSELQTLKIVTNYQGRVVRGLDPPRFEEMGIHFRVTLSATVHRAPATDNRNEAILAALAASSEVGLSTSQIAKKIKLSPRALRMRLASLVE